MKCPVCDVPLSISAREGVEIDFCPQCRGVWLDRGELDKILDRVAVAAPAGAPGVPSPASGNPYAGGPPQPYAGGDPRYDQPRYDEPRYDDRRPQRDDDRRHDSRQHDPRQRDPRKRKKSFLDDLFEFD